MGKGERNGCISRFIFKFSFRLFYDLKQDIQKKLSDLLYSAAVYFKISYWNSRDILFTQVSYSAGSPRLSDKTRYPKFFRINSAETKFNEAIVALLKRFQWSRVAVVKQDQGIFNDVSENFMNSVLWSNGKEGGREQ